MLRWTGVLIVFAFVFVFIPVFVVFQYNVFPFSFFELLRRHDHHCPTTPLLISHKLILHIRLCPQLVYGSLCCRPMGLQNCSLDPMGIIMSQGTDRERDFDAMSNKYCIYLHVSLYGSTTMTLLMFVLSTVFFLFIRTFLCLSFFEIIEERKNCWLNIKKRWITLQLSWLM